MPKPILVYTSGFLSLPPKVQLQVVKRTLKHLSTNSKVSLIVFSPKYNKPVYEDEGRTLILNYTEEVYAKLDDYGSSQNLSNKLGHAVDTQYVVTFLLPEDW